MKQAGTLLFYLLLTFSVIAAQPNQLVLDYIDSYSGIAIREMIDYKIPASITLAQGIIESGSGQSELAKQSNNHFGIKCHNDWEGDKVYYDDDAKGECFRKYDHVEDSYHDHSEFLSSKQRYAELFTLDPDDYKGWAKGLKAAGYATNPKYADMLINLIEEYELYKYDKMTLADIKKVKHDKKEDKIKEDKTKTEPKTEKQEKEFNWGGYAVNVFYFNRIPTITVRAGDTPERLATEHHTKVEQLYIYNDLKPGDELQPGSKFYLQPKRKNGDEKYHEVKTGETMWLISRDEGVRLDKLYQYNLLEPGQEPATGQQVNLRSKRNDPPKLQSAKSKPVATNEKTNVVTEKKNESAETEKPNPVEERKVEEIKTEPVEELILFEDKDWVRDDQEGELIKADTVPSNDAPAIEQTPEKISTQPEGVKQAVYHVVQPKETLYGLSKKYQISVEQIQQWNNLPDNSIKIGQQLIVGYQ